MSKTPLHKKKVPAQRAIANDGGGSLQFKDERPESKKMEQLSQLMQKGSNNSSSVIQRNGDEIPDHRLHPEIQKPKAEDWAAHEKKWNYGDGGSGQESLERNNMRAKGEYARALDELSSHPKWSKTERHGVPEKVQWSSVQGNVYYTQALVYYVGPREAGHAIWLAFQENLKSLIEDAFMQGYALNRPSIQKLLVKAATNKALYESDGMGSAGRSTTMRR